MKKNTLFILILLLVFSSVSYSQWTWSSGQTVTGTGTFPSISVVDQNIVWVAGGVNTPSIWRSTNAGANFTSAVGTGITLDVFCVWGVSATTAYVGDGGVAGGQGGNAKVYRTTDGGVTWTTMLSTGGNAGFINGMVFSKTNPQVGMIQSDPPAGTGTNYWIQLTTNGGTNWNSITCPGVTGAASAQNSIVVIDALFYGFGLNAGTSRVRYTSDGGSAWVTQSTVITGAFMSGFAFSTDKQRGIAISSASLPNIAKTTNANTWTTQNLGTGFSGYGTVKWIEGTNVIYISAATATGGSHFKRSTDGGLTWTAMTTSPSAAYAISHMEFYKASNGTIYGFAAAGDGSILKLVDNILTGGVNNNGNVPTEYKLEQNYPNPFNPTTTINYSIPKGSEVKIVVYDMLGHEINTIVNEFKTTGNYSVVFDASNLASGIYYYKISAGDFKDTKKMILVK
jgi:hypothetical protein